MVEVYRAAEFPRAWLKGISDYCRKIGIDFFSSPYDTEAVDLLERIGVPAHKLGAGEIDNLEFIAYVAKTGKPVIISAGAATRDEIRRRFRHAQGRKRQADPAAMRHQLSVAGGRCQSQGHGGDRR